jgi:hypothetical protein
MGGKLSGGNKDGLDAAGLALDVVIGATDVDRRPAAEIGELEGGLSVTAVGGAKQVEEDIVLGDLKGLALAKEPAYRL